MSDTTDEKASPNADRTSPFVSVDGVVGCVEIWEQLSADREAGR
ncbi:MAG: hypothetical protein ACI9EZ_000993, partial [Halobacteriales archaeon]